MQVGGKVVGSSSSNSSIVVEVIVIVVVLYLVRLQKHRAHGVFFLVLGAIQITTKNLMHYQKILFIFIIIFQFGLCSIFRSFIKKIENRK